MSKSGRPLRGSQKRVRVSYTLPPDLVSWLKGIAQVRQKSFSVMLEEMIVATKKQVSDHETILPIYIPPKKLTQFCQKYHVKKLSLFGSVLTPEFGSDSDVDVLLQFQSDFSPSLFDLIPMEEELSQIFQGRKADIKTAEELSPYFRDEVLKTAEVYYHA
jgi:uncharacterized protein